MSHVHVPHVHRRFDDRDATPPVPSSVTQEQLDFFTLQTRRAVRKALRSYSRRALIGFSLLFAAFVGLVLYTQHIGARSNDAVVNSGKAVAVASCNRAFHDRQAVRGVLFASLDFTRQAAKAGRLTPDEAQRRVAFYRRQIAQLALPDCRRSEDVLTADPGQTTIIPPPLWVDARGVVHGGSR